MTWLPRLMHLDHMHAVKWLFTHLSLWCLAMHRSFGDCNHLEAAWKVKLQRVEVFLFFIVLSPAGEHYILQSRELSMSTCIMVQRDIPCLEWIWRTSCICCARPLNLDGQGLAQHILDRGFGLTSLHIELNPLGIPAKGRIFDCHE